MGILMAHTTSLVNINCVCINRARVRFKAYSNQYLLFMRYRNEIVTVYEQAEQRNSCMFKELLIHHGAHLKILIGCRVLCVGLWLHEFHYSTSCSLRNQVIDLFIKQDAFQISWHKLVREWALNTKQLLTSTVHALAHGWHSVCTGLARRDKEQLNCFRAEPGECHILTSHLQVCLVSSNGSNSDFHHRRHGQD